MTSHETNFYIMPVFNLRSGRIPNMYKDCWINIAGSVADKRYSEGTLANP